MSKNTLMYICFLFNQPQTQAEIALYLTMVGHIQMTVRRRRQRSFTAVIVVMWANINYLMISEKQQLCYLLITQGSWDLE